MITFDLSDIRFTYRTAGVAFDDDHVLLNRVEGYDWWFLPGGRVEMGEPSADSLAREMLEELDAAVQVGRLLWVAETFFTFLTGQAHHELGFYFLMQLASDSSLLGLREPFPRDEGDLRLIFQWHPISSLEDLSLYPIFLRQGLRKIPDSPVHIVSHE